MVGTKEENVKAVEKLKIRGFKSIEKIENLELNDINIVIGANGSGKSNFLEAFSFLNAIHDKRLSRYSATMGGADNILYFGSRVTKRMQIGLTFGGGGNAYEVSIGATATRSLLLESEKAGFTRSDPSFTEPYWESQMIKGGESSLADSKSHVAKYVNGHLKKWKRFHFHDTSFSSPLKGTSNINDNRFLRFDGENLASFLRVLKITAPTYYEEILFTVQQMAPYIQDFRLIPQTENPDLVRLEWVHRGSDAFFDVSSFSDGTLRFIALATLFLQPNPPSLILIDEPELGLHPLAITLLGNIIRRASTRAQIIVATQSPALLDHFSPEETLVAERINNATVFNRPDAGELEEWLEEYSLGELWEKNYLGGRPGGRF